MLKSRHHHQHHTPRRVIHSLFWLSRVCSGENSWKFCWRCAYGFLMGFWSIYRLALGCDYTDAHMPPWNQWQQVIVLIDTRDSYWFYWEMANCELCQIIIVLMNKQFSKLCHNEIGHAMLCDATSCTSCDSSDGKFTCVNLSSAPQAFHRKYNGFMRSYSKIHPEYIALRDHRQQHDSSNW